jgi:hypothetical protein
MSKRNDCSVGIIINHFKHYDSVLGALFVRQIRIQPLAK